MRLLRPYNPLVYPAGRLPGIDPVNNLFAFGGGKIRFSVVALGSGPTNLLNGFGPSATNPAPVFGVDGIVGPIIKYPGVTSGHSFSGNYASTAATYNFAAILVPTASLNFGALFVDNNGSPGTVSMQIHNLNLSSAFGAGSFNNSLFPTVFTINTPYFICTTASPTGVSSQQGVAVNLRTGQIMTFSSAIGSGTNVASNGLYLIGTDAIDLSGNQPAANIAALMYGSGPASSYLTMESLLKQAADPWSLWYPPAQTTVMFSSLRQPLSVVGDTLFGTQRIAMF